MVEKSFSARHGFVAPAEPISVRLDAPQPLRSAIVTLADSVGLSPKAIRDIICGVLLEAPDPNNWSYGPVIDECRGLLAGAVWFRVYDAAEKLSKKWTDLNPWNDSNPFDERLNQFFVEHGYGWQISDSIISVRGTEAFEVAVRDAENLAKESDTPTVGTEIREARIDLSRRPEPDLTGAVHHSMNALDCLARAIDGSDRSLGQIIPELNLPKPLDQGVDKLWGFASQRGRHVSEGKVPTYEEAELVVTVSSAVVAYLLKKSPQTS